MSYRKYVILLIIIYTIASCNKDNGLDVNNNSNLSSSFNIDIDSFGVTSKWSNSKESIQNFNLLIYNNSGDLIFNNFYSSTTNINIETDIFNQTNEDSIHVYVIANYSQIDPNQFNRRENIQNLSISSIYSENGNLIYSGYKGLILEDCTTPIYIKIKPIAAKYSFIIDKTNLNIDVDINLISIEFCNVTNSINLFKANRPNHTKIDPNNPEYIIPIDNWNYTTYIPENAQGVLGNNNNPIYKDPQYYEDCCTYININAHYRSFTKEGPIVYRYYLGENNTNDFNIFRNRHYIETIVFKGSAIQESSWRVFKDSLKDINNQIDELENIYFKNSIYYIDVGESSSLNVETDPADYNLKFGDIIYTSANSNIAQIENNSGEITGINSGIVNINAKYKNDNSINTSCSVYVTDLHKISVNYIEHLTYDQITQEITDAHLSIFCRVDLPYPSDMSIVQQIYPILYAKVQYSYIQNNSLNSGELNLRLNINDNNDNPHYGLSGEQKLFFSTNFSSEQEYNEILESLELRLEKIDLYVNLLHIINNTN